MAFRQCLPAVPGGLFGAVRCQMDMRAFRRGGGFMRHRRRLLRIACRRFRLQHFAGRRGGGMRLRAAAFGHGHDRRQIIQHMAALDGIALR